MSVTLTGDQVNLYADNMAMLAIATEIARPGMALTGKCSGLEALRRRGLIEGRTTKVAGFRKAIKAMKERWEGWEPSGTVVYAITKLKEEEAAKKAAKTK